MATLSLAQRMRVTASQMCKGFSVPRGRRSAPSRETILIFRIGSLGDTIVALPCFHRIANTFSDCRRVLVTNLTSGKSTPVESVLDGSGLIQGAIYFPPPPRRWHDIWTLRNRIREIGATTLVYVGDRTLLQALRDIYFFRACGIQRIIGAPFARDLRCPRTELTTGDTEHEAERLARCLSALGAIDLRDRRVWDLRLRSCEIRAADAILGPLQGHRFVALGLGGLNRRKHWGNEGWSTLLRMLAARYPGLGLIFVGSSDEFDRCGTLATHFGGPMINLCGQLSARETAAALQRAIFYLGHDSGPMHLAAAVGTRCIALFGPASEPKRWYPMGAGHRIIHNKCSIHRIEPSCVMSAIEELLLEAGSWPNVSPPVTAAM